MPSDLLSSLAVMQTQKQPPAEEMSSRVVQFVVRLEQPGLYDELYEESIRQTRSAGRRVPMTAIAREAFVEYLEKRK